MKKRISFVCVYFCLLSLLCFGAVEMFARDRGERFSESENRMLAPFPELSLQSVANGSFMRGVEGYLSDAFPFREDAAGFTDAVMQLVSIPDGGPATGEMDEERLWEHREEQDAAFQQLIEEGRVEEEPEQPGETSGPHTAATPGSGKVEDLVIWLDRADGEREVLFTFSSDSIVSLAGILNRYRAKLPETGRLYFVSPQVSAVANNVIGQNRYVGWGTNLVEVLQPLVDDGVIIMDDMAILNPYLKESPAVLYPVEDYHWHAIGASLTADALMREQGLAPTDYDQYRYWLTFRDDKREYSTEQLAGMNFGREAIAVMSPISPAESYFLHNVTERLPSVFTQPEGGYLGFLGGHKGPWRLIEGGFHTGRQALVVGDCFTIPLIPYLAPYYDQIISTDVRDNFYSVELAGANIGDYIAHYQVDDIYIVLTNSGGFIKDDLLARLSAYLDMKY